MSNVAINPGTNAIGLLELRTKLSSYIDQVKSGHTYTLTHHGKPVARLVPVNGQSSYERLVVQGVIQPAFKRPSNISAPITTSGTVSDLISEQRR